MKRHFVSSILMVSFSALLTWAMPVLAAPNEPKGWENARFLMKLDAVRVTYPELKKVEVPNAPPPNPNLGAFPLERWFLINRKVGDLTCGQIIFQFLQGQLTHIEFYCGDPKKAEAYLIKEYGEPSTRTPKGWQWYGTRTYITFKPENGIFNLSSKRGHEALQGLLYMYYLATPEEQKEGKPPMVELKDDDETSPPEDKGKAPK